MNQRIGQPTACHPLEPEKADWQYSPTLWVTKPNVIREVLFQISGVRFGAG
jgi:hypothetical protein